MLKSNVYELEVLYDLTWNFAGEPIEFIDQLSDSRERFRILLGWTREFQEKYKGADWDTLDYIETVDAFYKKKIFELRKDLREGCKDV